MASRRTYSQATHVISLTSNETDTRALLLETPQGILESIFVNLFWMITNSTEEGDVRRTQKSGKANYSKVRPRKKEDHAYYIFVTLLPLVYFCESRIYDKIFDRLCFQDVNF